MFTSENSFRSRLRNEVYELFATKSKQIERHKYLVLLLSTLDDKQQS